MLHKGYMLWIRELFVNVIAELGGKRKIIILNSMLNLKNICKQLDIGAVFQSKQLQ